MLEEYNGLHKVPMQLESNLHKYSNKSHINLCESDKDGGGRWRRHSSFNMPCGISDKEESSGAYVVSFAALGLSSLLLIFHANSHN